jgi:glycosyltransferase involved in cell wall biosynthesis
MFGAADRVRNETGIHFLFIGQGARRGWMENEVRRKCLDNVTLLGYRPRGQQDIFLNACDISVVSLVSGLKGAGVPSRMYNAMAAGKPLLAVAESGSELCMVVNEEKIGWCVSPDDPDTLAEVIKKAMSDQRSLEEFGRRARRVAVEKYASDVILARYKSLIEGT